MEKYALELNGVTKQYKDFKLDSIQFWFHLTLLVI